MRLLLRGALAQRATVGQQTANYVLAAVLYYVGEAIVLVAKMATDGTLNLNKTLALWLTTFSPIVVAMLGVIIAALRGEPLPQPPA